MYKNEKKKIDSSFYEKEKKRGKKLKIVEFYTKQEIMRGKKHSDVFYFNHLGSLFFPVRYAKVYFNAVIASVPSGTMIIHLHN